MRFVPVICVMLLLAVFALGLLIKQVASPQQLTPLVGKPLPAFSIAALDEGNNLSHESLKGQLRIINFFASWCVSCRAEHPLLKTLAVESGVKIIGIAWRDTPQKAQNWLTQNGNPYALAGVDTSGSLTTVFGITGIPETYVIDADGTVLYQYHSVLTQQEIDEVILPLIRKATHAP